MKMPNVLAGLAFASLLMSIAQAHARNAQSAATSREIEVCNHTLKGESHQIGSVVIQVSSPTIHVLAYRKLPDRGWSATSSVKPRLTRMDVPGSNYVFVVGPKWAAQTVSPGIYQVTVDAWYMGLASDSYSSCVQVKYS